jgi:hypothetical protein
LSLSESEVLLPCRNGHQEGLALREVSLEKNGHSALMMWISWHDNERVKLIQCREGKNKEKSTINLQPAELPSFASG